MQRPQLEHIIRAAGITDAPAELLVSIEADVFTLRPGGRRSDQLYLMLAKKSA